MAQASALLLDGHTIASVENGLEEEIMRVWKSTEPRLLGLLAKITNRGEAADLLQETFMRVYQARERINGSTPANYIVRVAVNAALDHIRGHYAVQAATAEYLAFLKAHNKGQTQPNAEHRVLLREIEEAASRLSPGDQELLRNYSESTSITAAAKELDIPTTTLASRYYAVLRRLRQRPFHSDERA